MEVDLVNIYLAITFQQDVSRTNYDFLSGWLSTTMNLDFLFPSEFHMSVLPMQDAYVAEMNMDHY